MDKKIAIISDVHSNLVALEAVFEDIKDQSVDEIFFLGDVIGYGCWPNECIELIKENCSENRCISGNFENGFLNSVEFYGVYAKKTVLWAREKVTKNNGKWIAELDDRFYSNEALFVHGSPKHPLFEYITPHLVSNESEILDDNFKLIEDICFNGHTHIPSVTTLGQNGTIQSIIPDFNEVTVLSGIKNIINVGSVGQPRDEDPRACYLIWQDEIVTWRRIEYNIEMVIEEFKNLSGKLPIFEAQRLLEGR